MNPLSKTHRRVLVYAAIVLSVFAIQYMATTVERPRAVPYTELLEAVEGGTVKRVEIRAQEIRAELSSGGHIVAERLPGVEEPSLLSELRKYKVEISGRIEKTSWWQSIVGWILPFGLMIGVYILIMRRFQSKGGPLSFGKSHVKIYDRSKGVQVSFSDVAGVDEAVAELAEVVDFLKTPEKYTRLGAKIPKGVLLLGAPGTGKTLLAKAVAGEAQVPFFSMSGSEFVEMFVGVGAARIRSLFEQAKERAPCIVFVDELDAIGKSRGGVGAMATHDEREQTLNQLLVEMDGFDPEAGVVIMAATNRPEVLDPALVRAGRFDRQVLVDTPDIRGRKDILDVHCRKVELDDDVDLKVIGQRTPGMVGADLANIVNEAALAAARRGSDQVAQVDFEEAIDRVQLGLKKTSRAMNPEEKRRVAVHESGHTLVALSLDHADPVHRVTIVPRSIGALGATLQLPTEDRYLVTRGELLDKLCVMMGGRAAEALVCGDVSTGAENDLERATETARLMVCRFGMSDELGAQTFGRPGGSRFLNTPFQLGQDQHYSEQTFEAIDREVTRLLAEQRERAQRILASQRARLDGLTELLLEHETLDRNQLEGLAVPKPPQDPPLAAQDSP